MGSNQRIRAVTNRTRATPKNYAGEVSNLAFYITTTHPSFSPHFSAKSSKTILDNLLLLCYTMIPF